jgi:hypothetical protein
MQWRTKSAPKFLDLCAGSPEKHQRNLKAERVSQTGPVSHLDHWQKIRTTIEEFAA